MASSVLQTAFRAVRPCHRYGASAFMRECRLQSTKITNPKHAAPITTITPTLSRTFTTTVRRMATVVTKNPRMDEDGQEMSIIISERAAKRLKQITSTPPPKNTLTAKATSSADSHLRITVTSGGCHGFQYLMSLEDTSKIDAEEDTIFSFEDSGETDGIAQVVMDESSLELLKGSTVDFTTELIGSQFKIVGNPRATSSCGCGTSFDIE